VRCGIRANEAAGGHREEPNRTGGRGGAGSEAERTGSTVRDEGVVAGFDHVSLPMRNTDAMVAFYRALGLDVAENPHVVSVYVGNQMINLHRPATWRRGFTLRAPAAEPPCGDLCFVWDGSPAALSARLGHAGAEVVEGPVAREGGRRTAASSVYTRDPDGNLLEFMIYGDPDAG
jgi:catechol 2,3-dioxygenase-like lactoylglutathione lyase family enzyme